MDHAKEQTLILAKPDALQRGLVGEIIRRFEQKKFRLVALKMVRPTKLHVRKHYLPTKEQLEGMGNKTLEGMRAGKKDVKQLMGTDHPFKLGKIINRWNEIFLSSGPTVVMIFEGNNAVLSGRSIVGHTIPASAAPGTIRGDFSKDTAVRANTEHRAVYNLVHASGTVAEAKREIEHWFTAQELHRY